jgi:hypothetical protein
MKYLKLMEPMQHVTFQPQLPGKFKIWKLIKLNH